MSAISPGRDCGRYKIAHLHEPDGWLSPGYVQIDGAGWIRTVAGEAPDDWGESGFAELNGYVVPGMPNLHSHAHQRGLAGHAEGIVGGTRSDFWSWRDQMYAFLNRLSPDNLEAIATQAFVEMLKAGFTSVGEFHYLHHDPAGRPYANPAELSERIVAAAERAGVAFTLLPVFYAHGGIGQPPEEGQRRFIHHDVGQFLALVERLKGLADDQPLVQVGVAPHSVRAVSADELTELVAGVDEIDPAAPIHIHVAEQLKEVDECLTRLGARPVAWLLGHADVNDRWTLIHATHITPEERRAIAASGATVGLCPLTEANLGDGIFPLVEYQRDDGRWGIGADSNTAISLVDELRTLDYGQRLAHRHRHPLVTPGSPLTERPGRRLFDLAVAGGTAALAQPVGLIRPGMRADLVELDPKAAALAGQTPETVLDGWVFATTSNIVRNVMVAGTWIIRDGRHADEDRVLERFRAAISR
jgi:formimidoylglutamate deiminase